MTFEQPGHRVGTVFVDGAPYLLVLNKESQVYTTGYADEPPYSEGPPAMISDPSYTWHLGGLKSRQGIPGTSEYGLNTDGRWSFKLYPGPKLESFSLTGNTDPPTYAFSGLGYTWVLCGARIYRIDNTTGTVVLSTSGLSPDTLHGIEWEGEIFVTLTDGKVKQMSAIVPGGPDTWGAGTDTVEALYLAKGFNRLFKVHDPNSSTLQIQNLGLGLEATDAADWADEVNAPGQSNDIIAYERTVLVNAGLADGLYAVGEEGFGVPLARRLHPSGKLKFVEPFILVPHDDGLARMIPSATVEAIGLENELLNESPVQGIVTAVAADGYWYYMALYDGTNSYILTGRDRKGSEPALGPVIWDTLVYIADLEITFLEVFHRGSLPSLVVYNNGNNLGYFLVPHTGGTPIVNSSLYRFSQTGTRFSVKYNFDDRGEKFFNQVKAKGENLDANTYWDLAYSIDGTAWVTTDSAGVNMRVQSDALTTFYLANTAAGVDIQWRFSYVGESDTTPGRLTYFEPFAIPRSRRIEIVKATLSLETGARHEDRIDRRTTYQQAVSLHALLEAAAPVTLRGPWSEDEQTALIRDLSILEGQYESGYTQRMLVEAAFQVRRSS